MPVELIAQRVSAVDVNNDVLVKFKAINVDI